VATFATYVLSSDANILTADKAFVSLAFFNLLRGPLVAFPSIINSVVEVSGEISFGGQKSIYLVRQVYQIQEFKSF
jgi:hypothetical protein